MSFRRSLVFAVAVPILFGGSCSRRAVPTDPQKAVAKGWEDFHAALYDDAQQLFSDAAEQTETIPDSDVHLRALYAEASNAALRRPGGDYARARPIYEQVVRLAPQSEWAAWSVLALARMVNLPENGEKPSIPALVAAYQPVIDHFPFLRAGEEAFAFQQAARVNSFDLKENAIAAELMEKWVAAHPDSTFCSHVYRVLAFAYENLDQPDKAVAAAVRSYELYRTDPKNPHSDYASVYWSIANLANYRAGDFETARKFYQLLIKEYPTEKRVFTAKLALQTMDEIEASARTGAPLPALP